MPLRFACATALALLPAALAAQSYGFVARLGCDTVAVEKIVRTEQELVGDLVERNPQVIIRHYDAFLSPDGTVRRITVDSKMGNPAPGLPATQTVIADFSPDSMHVTIRMGDSTRSFAVNVQGQFVMPWLMMAYGTYEQLFLAARTQKGDSIAVGEYSPGARAVTRSWLRRLKGDSVALGYFGLPIYARVDRQGRLVALSGEHTTEKFVLERLKSAPNVDQVAQRFAATERAGGSRPLAISARDTVRAKVGNAMLTVDYGRPSVRCRTILGNVVPLDSVWRTGANAATQFSTTATMMLGSLELVPATYTLWTVPWKDGAILVVNKQHGQWGTEYDPAQDLGHFEMTVERVPQLVEQFTMRIEPGTGNSATLVMEWEHFRWKAPIAIK